MGRFLVDNSDVVLAFDLSGTSTTLRDDLAYAQSCGRPIIRVTALEPLTIAPERGHGLNAQSVSGIELYNAWEIQLTGPLAKFMRDTFGNDEGPGVAQHTRDFTQKHLAPHFVRADAIAMF